MLLPLKTPNRPTDRTISRMNPDSSTILPAPGPPFSSRLRHLRRLNFDPLRLRTPFSSRPSFFLTSPLPSALAPAALIIDSFRPLPFRYYHQIAENAFYLYTTASLVPFDNKTTTEPTHWQNRRKRTSMLSYHGMGSSTPASATAAVLRWALLG